MVALATESHSGSFTVLQYLDICRHATKMVGSYFNESSFTLSVDSASAALSIGVTFRETPGSSYCFLQNVDGGVVVPIEYRSAILTDKDPIIQVLAFVYPPTGRTCFT